MSRSSYDESDNLELYKKDLQAKTALAIADAKHVAEIKQALETSALAKAHAVELQNQESLFNNWCTQEQDKIKSILTRLRSEGATEEEVVTQRKLLNQAFEADRIKKSSELANLRKRQEIEINSEASKIASIHEANKYKTADIYTRKRMKDEEVQRKSARLEELRNLKEIQDTQLKALQKQKKAATSSEDQEALSQSIEQIKQQRKIVKAETDSVSKDLAKQHTEMLNVSAASRAATLKQVRESGDGASEFLSTLQSAAQETEAKLAELDLKIASAVDLKIDTSDLQKERQAFADELADINININSAEEEKRKAATSDSAIHKVVSQMEKNYEDQRAQRAEDKKARAEFNKTEAGKEKRKEDLQKELTDQLGKLAEAGINAINSNIDAFYRYQAHIEARLQGSGESYSDLLKVVDKNIGLSGLVSQKAVVENLRKLSDEGIAYNLELRSFLATVSDNIANTFDAFDSTLLRLIRLQQADTTAARLGLEASLTKLFNEYFKDTSYLNNMYDTVSSAIIDANAMMTRSASIEFEYILQKWLGALYSVGMDENTISTIAQGVNYLATGDVQSLNSNESLQSLLAMSASRAGIDFGEILVDGIDAKTTNELLYHIVEYLKEIADNPDNNQVSKSALANVFGFNISDLRAVTTLTTGDMTSLYDQYMTYNDSMIEVSNQLDQISKRVHLSQVVSTAIDNALAGAAAEIGSNPVQYALWEIANVLMGTSGGINIPSIMAAGFGVDLGTDLMSLLKMGMVGLPLIGNVLENVITGGSLFGSMDIRDWNYEEFLNRGGRFHGLNAGSKTGTSAEDVFRNLIANVSAEDIENTTLSDAADEAEEDEKIVNKHINTSETNLNDALISEDTDVLTEVIGIHQKMGQLVGFAQQGITSQPEISAQQPQVNSSIQTDSTVNVQTTVEVVVPEIPPIEVVVPDIPPIAVSVPNIPPIEVSVPVPNIPPIAVSVPEIPPIELVLPEIPSIIETSFYPSSDSTNGVLQEVMSLNELLKSYLVEDRIFRVQEVDSLPPYEEENFIENVSAITQKLWYSGSNYGGNYFQENVRLDQSSKELENGVTRLETLLSTTDIATITELMDLTSVSDSRNTSTSDVKSDNVNVTINEMSPEVSSYIAATVKTMVTSALLGTAAADGGSGMSLIEQLRNLLQNQEVAVKVTNDNFDTVLQKTAFSF